MRYGIVLPNMGLVGDAQTVIKLACEVEKAGWDGFFLWDTLHYLADGEAVYDPWMILASIAVQTKRLRIGTMVTPLTRRRPWNLARQTVTLDHISQGRLILGVGLGDVSDKGFTAFGEVTDAKQRAAMLDEGLEVLTGLWSGQPFSYHGKHYQIDEITFLPAPVQSPRIPIWVGGYWPRKGPFRRAARWDGIYPGKINTDGLISALAPSDVQTIKAFIEQNRTSDLPFDIVVEGETPTDNDEQARRHLRTFREAGATWWLEHVNLKQGGVQALYERIQQGPPDVN